MCQAFTFCVFSEMVFRGKIHQTCVEIRLDVWLEGLHQIQKLNNAAITLILWKLFKINWVDLG